MEVSGGRDASIHRLSCSDRGYCCYLSASRLAGGNPGIARRAQGVGSRSVRCLGRLDGGSLWRANRSGQTRGSVRPHTRVGKGTFISGAWPNEDVTTGPSTTRTRSDGWVRGRPERRPLYVRNRPIATKLIEAVLPLSLLPALLGGQRRDQRRPSGSAISPDRSQCAATSARLRTDRRRRQ